jgi:hypothetical protein
MKVETLNMISSDKQSNAGRNSSYNPQQAQLPQYISTHLPQQQQRTHALLETRKDIVQQHKQYSTNDSSSLKRLLTRYDHYISQLESVDLSVSSNHKLQNTGQKMSSSGFSFIKNLSSGSTGQSFEIQPFTINYQSGVFLWSGYEPILFAIPPSPSVVAAVSNPFNNPAPIYANNNTTPFQGSYTSSSYSPPPSVGNSRYYTPRLFSPDSIKKEKEVYGDLLFPIDSKIESFLVLGDKKKISPLFLTKNMTELTHSVGFELYMCYYNRGVLLYNTFAITLKNILPQNISALKPDVFEHSYIDLKHGLLEAVQSFRRAEKLRTDMLPAEKTAFTTIMSNYDGIDHAQGLTGLIDLINDGLGQLLVFVKIQTSLMTTLGTMQENKDIDLYFTVDEKNEDELDFFDTLILTQQSLRVTRKRWDEFNSSSGIGLKNFLDTDPQGPIISSIMKIIDGIYKAMLVACNYWRVHVADQLTKNEYDSINSQFTGINQHQGNIRFMFAQKILLVILKLVYNLPYTALPSLLLSSHSIHQRQYTNNNSNQSSFDVDAMSTNTTFESLIKGFSNITKSKPKAILFIDGIDRFINVSDICNDIKIAIELINSANETRWSFESNKDTLNITQILLDKTKQGDPFIINEKIIDQYTLNIGPLPSDYLFSAMNNRYSRIMVANPHQQQPPPKPHTPSDLAEHTISFIRSLSATNEPMLADRIINYLLAHVDAGQEKPHH